MSIKLGRSDLAGVNTNTIKNSRHLLEPFWSDHILNDLDCLRADTFSWHSGDVYVDAYNHLVSDIEGKTLQKTYCSSNVTLLGNAYNSGGILGNFTSYALSTYNNTILQKTGNYASINQAFNPATSSWEIMLKCKTPLNDTRGFAHALLGGNTSSLPIEVGTVNNGIAYLYLSSNNTSWDICNYQQSSVTLSGGTLYWFRLKCTNASGTYTYQLDYSTNGTSFTNLITVTSSSHIASSNYFILGASNNSGGTNEGLLSPWDGLIYLDGCYIKVDNNTIWTGINELSYYEADDGHIICPETEQYKVRNIYETTGISWYYILDTTNKFFKLPRTKFGFSGLRNKVGFPIEAGLPNIKGTVDGNVTDTAALEAFGECNYNNIYVDGCFQPLYGTILGTVDGDTSGIKMRGFTLDASLANSVYGKSNTVQSPATQMYLYFYVGEFTTNATEQAAGFNSELLNNKMDKDLSNITSSGLEMVSNASFPSTNLSNFVDLTSSVTSGSSYTAPSNGYFCINYVVNAGGALYVTSFPVDSSSPIMKAETALYGEAQVPAIDGAYCMCTVPVGKGQVVDIYYQYITINYITFIPAIGG